MNRLTAPDRPGKVCPDNNILLALRHRMDSYWERLHQVLSEAPVEETPLILFLPGDNPEWISTQQVDRYEVKNSKDGLLPSDPRSFHEGHRRSTTLLGLYHVL